MRERAQVREIAVQEIVFAIFFASVVAVARLQPGTDARQLLGYALAILSLNLGFFLYGKKRPLGTTALQAYFALNSIAAFAVLRQTGGRDSMFWITFLLPTLGAAVSPLRGGPWSVVGLDVVLLATAYWPIGVGYDVVEWLMKAATLAFAAGVTQRAYAGERKLRLKIDEKRLHLEYLATRLVADHQPVRTEGDILDQVEARLRLLESPLAVLEDSARLALLEAPEAKTDLKRIEACQKLIKSLTQDLFEILYHEEFWIEPASFEEIYRHVLNELRYPLAVKEVQFIENIDPNLPQIPMSRAHVEQYLHTVIGRASIVAEHRQTLEITAAMAGLEDEPYLEVVIAHPGISDTSSMSHLRRIAERHGGWLQLEYLTRSVRYTLALPMHRGVKLKRLF